MIKLILVLLLSSLVFGGKPNDRIVGGNTATAGQFPFTAAIYVQTQTGTYFYAGTIIDNQWILTSAQCINGAVQATIQLGSNRLQGNDQNRLVLSTSTFVPHPDFNPSTLENDIGLIKLHMPITFTDYVTAAYLPITSNLHEGVNAFAVGWGQVDDENAGITNDLRYVQLSVINNEECQLSFSTPITEKMICVVGNYNEGTCNGDSGGPLLLTLGRHAWVIGISSFISQNGCESTDPSGYTITYPYLDWIVETIQTQ